MNLRKVVIPAAGFGTRLAPLTQLMPKEMLPLGGKVVLQYVLEECDDAGLDTALVVINRRKTALFPVGEETPGAKDPLTGVPKRSVYFANQVDPGGLAHAILHAEAFTGDEPFAVALGDTLVHGGEGSLLGRMIAAHLEYGAAATIAAQYIPDDTISRYGVFSAEKKVGEVFRVREIVEKPQPAEAPSRYAVTARYLFSPEIYDAIRSAARPEGGEIALTDAVTHLARQGKTVLAVCLGPGQRRLDIGNPQSYAEAFRLLSENGSDGPA
jgi:UTP--glucose-1-phosphate uridylyltransferase